MKMLKKFLIYFLIFIMFLTFNNASKAQNMGTGRIQALYFLNQAIAAGITNSPSLHASMSKSGISEAKILSFKTLTNPYFTFQNSIVDKSFSYGLERTFVTGGVSKYQTKIAELNNEIDKLDLEKQKLEIKQQVREAYIQYYSAKEILKTYQEVMETGKKLIEKAKIREKSKQITHLEILKAEADLLNFNNNVEHYKYHVITKENNLEKLLGEDLPEKTELEEPTELPEALKKEIGSDISLGNDAKIEKLTQIALNKRPSMLIAKKMLEIAETEKKLALASRFPIMILSTGVIIDGEEKTCSPYINGNIELPVFERNQSAIKEAKANIEYNKDQEKISSTEIKYQIKSAYNEVIAAKETIDRYKSLLLPKAEELMKESKIHGKNSKFSLSIVIDAEKTYLETRLAYLHMIVEYQKAISDLERYVGISL